MSIPSFAEKWGLSVPETPQQLAKVAVCGALGSRVFQFGISSLRNQTNFSVFGEIFAAIIPPLVARQLKGAAEVLNSPLKGPLIWIKRSFINPMVRDAETHDQDIRATQIAKIYDIATRCFLVPIGEEAIFRYGVQILGAQALKAAGIPSEAAAASSALVANILFGLAHSESRDLFEPSTFNNSFAAGLVMSLLCDQYGLPTSMIAHVIHNTSCQLEETARRALNF